MNEKEFEGYLQKHRRERRRKIKTLGFCVLPAIIGILIIFVILTNMIYPASYTISGIVPHKSPIILPEEIRISVSQPAFFSPDLHVYWEACDANDMESPASIRFKAWDYVGDGSIYSEITTTTYSKTITRFGSNWVEFEWINEDPSKDIHIFGIITYYPDLFWIALWAVMGIILIAYSFVFCEKISKQEKRK